MSDMDTWRKAEQERRERLNAQYAAEPWGKLAIKAGFDPYYTESAARMAFDFCSKRIAELEAEVARKNEALAPFAEEADRYPPGSDWNYPACYSQFLIGVLWDARAALAAPDTGGAGGE